MMELYCTYDRVAQRYEAPAPFISKAVAIRAFENIIRTDNTITGLNYRDFDLMRVGTFDELTGIISPVNPLFICSGLDVRKETYDTEEE